MKTKRKALVTALYGVLFVLPFATLQSLVFWHVSELLLPSFIVFILWFLALVPMPGLRVLASFPGYPSAFGLGKRLPRRMKDKSKRYQLIVGFSAVAGTCIFFVNSFIYVNILFATIALISTIRFGLQILFWLQSIPAQKTEIKIAVSRLAPQAIIYTGRRDGGPYQIQQWLSSVQSTTAEVLIVTRHASASTALFKSLPLGTPIITCPENTDLDGVLQGTAKIVFYVNSHSSNSSVVSYRSLHHVYLGHGDSDKEISAHPVHRMYDSIFVSGQAAIDRYETHNISLDPGQAVCVGRPQLSDVISATIPRAISTFLYAPTWSGYNQASNLSSLHLALPFIQDCLDRGIRVLFRPHPLSFTRAADRLHILEIDHLLRNSQNCNLESAQTSGTSLSELFNEADALLTDVSSMIIEFMASNKPIAVVSATCSARSIYDRYPSTLAAYIVASPDSLAWEQMLSDDPLSATRNLVTERYISCTSGARFTEAVSSILNDSRTRNHS